MRSHTLRVFILSLGLTITLVPAPAAQAQTPVGHCAPGNVAEQIFDKAFGPVMGPLGRCARGYAPERRRVRITNTIRPSQRRSKRRLAVTEGRGLPGFQFHDLRHTVVTDLLEAGEPKHVIQDVPGQLSERDFVALSLNFRVKGQYLFVRAHDRATAGNMASTRRPGT